MIFGVDSFQFWISIAAMGAGLLGVAWMVLLESTPRDLTKPPRLIPTTPVMFLAALVAVLALVHLVNLFGVKTGR
jgi:hypothetical protein